MTTASFNSRFASSQPLTSLNRTSGLDVYMSRVMTRARSRSSTLPPNVGGGFSTRCLSSQAPGIDR